MTLSPFSLASNEKILRRACLKAKRPFNNLIIWASVTSFTDWETWILPIARWPQYLEACKIYDCMLMRPGLKAIRLDLMPLKAIVPEYPTGGSLPVYREVAGLFRPSYMRQRGF